MKRRLFLKSIGLSGAIFASGCFTSPNAFRAKQPNIIIFLADDQGYGDLSITGNSNLNTPNVDSLAMDGARFDRFFACPMCAPTRAEFLTGRYHPRSGVCGVTRGRERLNLDEKTVADTFKAAGYATGAFGKWHSGMQYPYHPNGRGFEEYYGFCSGHWGNYFDPLLEHNGKPVKGNGFVIDDFTDKAMSFIQKNTRASKPFLAYLPYNTPHSPMQVPDKYWDRFKDKTLDKRHRDKGKENINHTRAALAMCENIDWNIGRVLKKLKELDIEDNTIVIYFSDNGPNGYRWNQGMKGKKGSTDEGGLRSPLFIRWPGKISPDTEIDRIAGAIDLLPTLTDLADVKRVGNKPLDGKSLVPLLFRQETNWPDRMIFSHWNRQVSVRTQKYRLGKKGQLFDMINDPGQRKDVSKQYPDVTSKLQKEVDIFKAQVVKGYDQYNRPLIVGHKDFVYTQLPARDANSHGNIIRSNFYPNCSFFTNWKSVDDYISWDIEVGLTGDYDIQIYYTCPKEDIGSDIELQFNDCKLRCKVTKGHNPPLTGAENDRVRRIESYVKDFAILKAGKMHLKKGTGSLNLRAKNIPASQAMDVSLLMFKRIS